MDEALKEKELGNASYKKRDFEAAALHYGKAIELCPLEVTFRTNLAAVHFEEKKYDECIKICTEAVEVGRENRADFKLIAKAYARMGNAYRKSGDLRKAKTAFEKALTEHRTPDYKTALSEVEASLKKMEEEAYVNPELGEEEKMKGNALFKSGDFSGAIKHYTEAIKRNPADCKIYSNRAACYTKLLSFDLALKDCDKAITMDPKFVKAYLRKANALKWMGKVSEAMSTYEKTLEIDPNCGEAVEGYRACMQQTSSDPEERRQRAMNDPEVREILANPVMRMILEQMQADPNSVGEHLKNPDIKEKFMKLRESGLVSVAYK